jgi:hypothetical protein
MNVFHGTFAARTLAAAIAYPFEELSASNLLRRCFELRLVGVAVDCFELISGWPAN